MIKFRDIPFLRLDMAAYRRHFEEELGRLETAERFEEAYDALLDLDTLMVKYQTMATICEIRNTMDVTDQFYKEEAAYCDQLRPEYDALENRLNKALVKSPYRDRLSEYTGREVFLRAELKERCFSPEVAEDLREENRLSARYSEMTATLTADTEQGRVPLSSIGQKLVSDNRAERAKYNKIAEESWAGIGAELDAVYDGLVKIRAKIAQKLGMDSYTQFGYCQLWQRGGAGLSPGCQGKVSAGHDGDFCGAKGASGSGNTVSLR